MGRALLGGELGGDRSPFRLLLFLGGIEVDG